MQEKALMNDPSTFWLTFTNIAMGVVTLICLFAMVIIIVLEIVRMQRRRRASVKRLDQEWRDLAASIDCAEVQMPAPNAVLPASPRPL